jgi:folate-binding protein YgfZ
MSALVLERSRGLFRVTGRDPVGMIHGLATADIEAVAPDRGAYTAFLTPKGRMVADARVFRLGDGSLLLDIDPGAAKTLGEHIGRFVPPLFAKAEDVSAAWAVVGVYGPGADAVAGKAAASLGARGVPRDTVEERVVRLEDGFAARTRITGNEGWDFFVPADRRDQVVETLVGAGGRPGDPEALEALRVAAGRPRWGRELTEEVIPLEAGLLDRAISQTKGCYTGQEVIVRILHRGHVNRHLRRLEFSGAPPDPGTELFEPGGRARGVVTSAVANEAGAIGLGFVRREIEPPAEMRLGSPDGDPVLVEALD